MVRQLAEKIVVLQQNLIRIYKTKQEIFISVPCVFIFLFSYILFYFSLDAHIYILVKHDECDHLQRKTNKTSE